MDNDISGYFDWKWPSLPPDSVLTIAFWTPSVWYIIFLLHNNLRKKNFVYMIFMRWNLLVNISIWNHIRRIRRRTVCTNSTAFLFTMQTEIHTSHLCISTQTNKYFPKADEFIPERWLRSLDGEMSYKKVHPFVTMPFGFGLRSCVGKRFAVLEMEILLAKVKKEIMCLLGG